MKDIVIIGAGGFGKEVAWLIEQINKKSPTWNLVGFVDDQIEVETIVNGYPVLGDIDYLNDKAYNLVCSISHPQTRYKIVSNLESTDNNFVTLIHPDINLSSTVSIGEGSIICEGTRFTVNISIGKHVIIYHNSVICHDSSVGDYTSILPSVNISGNVIIKGFNLVGTGSQIVQNLKIGQDSIIGAGAVVINNINPFEVHAGVPAKMLKKLSE